MTRKYEYKYELYEYKRKLNNNDFCIEHKERMSNFTLK
jgi:hypothetical protein